MVEKANLLEQVSWKIHAKHLAYQTEKIYSDWIYRFITFHEHKHLSEIREEEIKEFLSFLADDRQVSASAQNQARRAITFLYREVWQVPITDSCLSYARPRKRLPVVLSREDVRLLLSLLEGETWLMASLLYGGGLQLMECLSLRIKDINFTAHEISVYHHSQLRVHKTLLPLTLNKPLQIQVEKARIRWEENLLLPSFAGVSLSEDLCQPKVTKALSWQYLFPSRKPQWDIHSDTLVQPHREESYLQKAFKKAVRNAGICLPVSCHTLRHSFALHMLEEGCPVKMLQSLLGHASIRTTMMYTRLLHQSNIAIKSPLDVPHFLS